MRVLLVADLHLDAEFGWLGPGEVARRRRETLRRTLLRITEIARTENVDALLCAGDLYEHERVTPDTAAFLQRTFASLHPIRVYLSPGNHDWYGPESPYRRGAWTDNVHVFTEARLLPVTLADGLTLWGAAHRAPAGTDGFLGGFRVDRGGVHLALFHGSETAGLRDEAQGKHPHAPFAAEDIPAAGLHHACLGHYHRPRDGRWHTYPGNPEPLTFGETGERGAVLVEVGPDGGVRRERRRVATTALHDRTVDLGGCITRSEVRERVDAAVAGLEGFVRLTLEGELGGDVDLAPRDLAAWSRELGAASGSACEGVALRFGSLRLGHDLETIRTELTVRGQFVRDVLAAGFAPDHERRVLTTGLRALDGRDDLEVP